MHGWATDMLHHTVTGAVSSAVSYCNCLKILWSSASLAMRPAAAQLGTCVWRERLHPALLQSLGSTALSTKAARTCNLCPGQHGPLPLHCHCCTAKV